MAALSHSVGGITTILYVLFKYNLILWNVCRFCNLDIVEEASVRGVTVSSQEIIKYRSCVVRANLLV
jgi:hypothetical protein